MFNWKIIPKSVKAEPSLRGLIVRDAERDGLLLTPKLYPWSVVGRVQPSQTFKYWVAYDDEGNPVREDGHPMHLKLANDHAHRIAVKAQERHFLRAFKCGGLDLADKCDNLLAHLLVGWLMVILLAGLWLYGVIWIARASWRIFKEGMLLPEHLPLLVIATVLMVAGMTLMAGVAVWVFFLQLVGGSRVMLARYDEVGVTAKLHNGTEVRHAWSALSNVSRSSAPFHVHFGGSGTLTFPRPGPRTKTLIRVATRRFLPHEEHRTTLKLRRSGIRLIALSAITAIAGALIIESYSIPGESRGGALAFGVAALVLGCGVGTLLLFHKQLETGEARIAKSWHRRTRRKRLPLPARRGR